MPIHVKAISVNDTVQYNLRAEDQALIKSVNTVYAYDCELRVHCCELLPSYELHYLYTYIECADEVDSDLVDELDNRYCYEPNEDGYMHCGSKVFDSAKDCGTFDDMESAREYLCGNCPF